MTNNKLFRWVAGLAPTALVAFALLAYLALPPAQPVRAQLGAVQTWAGTATGLNTIAISLHNVGVSGDLLGVPIRFLPAGTNAPGGVTVTVNLDGGGTIGPVNVLKRSLSGGLTSLVGSELQASQIATITYDGTQFECSDCTTTVPTGSIQDFVGLSIPAGWVKTDGSALSRTTFAVLFNTIVSTTTATTTVSSTNVLVPSSTGYSVGWFVGGSNVTCNVTITAIPDSTHITISSNALSSGATTLSIGPNPMGDCSTTFNVPNLVGRTTAMVDGGTNITSATCTNAGSIGAQCGSQTQTLTLAQLPTNIQAANASQAITVAPSAGGLTGVPVTTTPGNISTAGCGTGAAICPASNSASWGGTATFAGANAISVTSTNTSGTSHPILPPVFLVYKIIKT